jgi:hypothetical protein
MSAVALVGKALLFSRIAAASNAVLTIMQAVQAASALLEKAHAENREPTEEEINAIFAQDALDLAALDAKLKGLGA